MSRQVNLYEAKTNLSQLVEDAAQGEEIIIAKNGRQMARLVPAAAEAPPQRALGQWAGLLTPHELKLFRSGTWWREWKKADAEIERDFEGAPGQVPKKEETTWPATSSTPMRSSGPKRIRTRSVRKRLRK
ncbi:MAG TPA: type II toxin-antitoxin system prevent-host-death family antitoxin [Rhizomicrobium sp.]|jgi:prevent-host-death family protein|nr:type II toxin-antitoxin system prevent-host-death family antitoxin [Rhizomicrobium sp.]